MIKPSEIKDLLVELKQSPPTSCLFSLGVSAFGAVVLWDPFNLMKAVFLAWVPYTAIIGGLIAAVIFLIIWIARAINALINRRNKTRYSREQKKREDIMVDDHIEHLDRTGLMILLAMLRTPNGRAEQTTHSTILSQMKNYKVIKTETSLWSKGDGAETVVVSSNLLKSKKKSLVKVEELLKTRHNLENIQTDTLKTLVEGDIEKYGQYGRKKILTIPTLK